jgi:SRSO17 transposase
VNCHYAERTLGWPVTTRLYLTQGWAEDLERRKAAGVPEAVVFQTKPDIALDLIDTANRYGVAHAAVVADAGYGDNPLFLNGLEARGEHYVVEVHSRFHREPLAGGWGRTADHRRSAGTVALEAVAHHPVA